MRTEADNLADAEFGERIRRARGILSELEVVKSLLASSVVRNAEGHRRDCLNYENLIEQAIELLGVKRYDRLIDGIRRLIAERDEARQAKLDADRRAGFAEACCGCDNAGEHVLPSPSPIKPEHWRFAAELIRRSGHIGSWTAENLEWQAKGLEVEQADAKRVQDEAIESAITAYFDEAHGGRPKTVYPHVHRGMKAALRAARELGESV
ncbi:hypothetical protein SEA_WILLIAMBOONE_95 [Gordonia phage WilliamBoone]|nr:hypothetical protein SEA_WILLIAMBOONE_95 [Gordonia phage WilliamBoone]